MEHFKRKCKEKDEEIKHYESFVAELENETPLKSMLANIQSRFLIALRQKNDGMEDQINKNKELGQVKRKLEEMRKLWKVDRQRLVDVILTLQFSYEVSDNR